MIYIYMMAENAPTSDLSATYQRWEFGASEDSQPFRTDMDPQSYAKTTMLWVKDLGVRLVGGCCGIGPGNAHVSLSFYNREDFNTLTKCISMNTIKSTLLKWESASSQKGCWLVTLPAMMKGGTKQQIDVTEDGMFSTNVGVMSHLLAPST